MTYSPPIDGPYERALARYAPLISALMRQLGNGYLINTENTGGHIYLLFVRNTLAVVARDMDTDYGHLPSRTPDRCVVFSEFDDMWAPDLDDATPWTPASFVRYADWTSADDVGDGQLFYADGRGSEPAIHNLQSQADAIARWAAPRIREWLSREERPIG